ncbi:MAG: SAM-dependent methyltransferase [Thermoactinomyces sp.]
MMKNPLLGEIIKRIEESPEQGIPFPKFMEMALYHPRWGYYQRNKPKLGREGDFFTNAHVGELYGQVLGRFCAKWIRRFAADGDWMVVEMGAGDGRLAEQVGKGLIDARIPPEEIRFHLVETSPFHQRLERARLASSPISYRFHTRLQEIPPGKVAFIYSNELVDAFPVHRIKKDGGLILEAWVAKGKDDKLTQKWIPLGPDSADLIKLGSELHDGEILEVSQAAHQWLKEVARWLNKGVLVTIDYGASTRVLRQKKGTLRGFKKHRVMQNILEAPGEIDLTCDVNFSLLEEWGRQEGLIPAGNFTQMEFLLKCGIAELLPSKVPTDPFSPEAKRVREIKQLIHPHAMGESFRILIQCKGLEMNRGQMIFNHE